MTLDERHKCELCGSAKLRTIKGRFENERIQIRDCENKKCKNNGKEIKRVFK